MTPSITHRTVRTAALLVLPLLALLGAACGSDTTTATGGASAATTTTGAASPGSQGASGSAAAPKKVSANTASASEIQAALTAAGVSNAARWTNEVMEYRPYDTSDPSLSKLKKELAKYHPDAATLEKILSALEP